MQVPWEGQSNIEVEQNIRFGMRLPELVRVACLVGRTQMEAAYVRAFAHTHAARFAPSPRCMIDARLQEVADDDPILRTLNDIINGALQTPPMQRPTSIAMNSQIAALIRSLIAAPVVPTSSW